MGEASRQSKHIIDIKNITVCKKKEFFTSQTMGMEDFSVPELISSFLTSSKLWLLVQLQVIPTLFLFQVPNYYKLIY